MLLSVIIPVYNEESTVSEVIETVAGVLLPIDKEIIVVDDGSDDGTAGVLGAHDKELVQIFTHSTNRGKGAAVRAGFKAAKGDIVLIQDADLETDPNEYIKLITPILEGEASVVFGSRFLAKNENVPRTRRLANYLLTALTNVLYRTSFSDIETAYKCFSSEVLGNLTLNSDGFEIEAEITSELCKQGIAVMEVPISYRPRTKSEGKKIRFQDGIIAVFKLIRCRFL